jgi:hypothetical protein
MEYEDIEVRIQKDGVVQVKVLNASQEQLRSYREMLEEMIGPITRLEIIQGRDWESGVSVEDSEKLAKQTELGRG